MKCLGRTNKFRRCKRNCRYGFCFDHWLQPLLLFIALGTGLIWITDLSESLGFNKKPIDIVQNSKIIDDYLPTNNEIATTNIEFENITKKNNDFFTNIKFKNFSQRNIDNFNCDLYLIKRPKIIAKPSHFKANTIVTKKLLIKPNLTYKLKSDTLSIKKPIEKKAKFYLMLHYSYKINGKNANNYEFFRVESPRIGVAEDFILNSDEEIILKEYAREVIKINPVPNNDDNTHGG